MPNFNGQNKVMSARVHFMYTVKECFLILLNVVCCSVTFLQQYIEIKT